MKRKLIPGLMFVSAFTLTNCTEQLVDPIQENGIIADEILEAPADGLKTPYEVMVEDAATKTISEGGVTYWVSEASAIANNMDRSAVDKINLFSIPTTDGSKYTAHGEFTYMGNQTFAGELTGGFDNLPETNNWVCIYPSSAQCSSSASTANIIATVTIGHSSLSGIKRGDLSHIAGTNHPMYGIKNNVPKEKTPKFKMSHLYALVALEIVNVGDGNKNDDDQNITIQSVKFTAPDNIIGDFNVIVTDDKHSFSGAGNNVSSVELNGLKEADGTTNITIAPHESAVLYFAIKPYDASGDELKITINGSEKKVRMPENTRFVEGKKTTLRVPVKLSYPKESTEALAFLPIGDNIAKKDVVINGESINAYMLYKEYERVNEGSWLRPNYVWKYTDPQSLPIEGNVKDLFNALGAGFYASHWEGLPAAMTLESINLWLPYNGQMVHISQYPPFAKGLAADMGWSDWIVSAVLPYLIPESDGIKQSEGLIKLNSFIDPASVTFNGIVSNGTGEDNPKIFMLDDETIHKKVGKTNVENLLSTKFVYKTPLGEMLIPTYQGLLDIVNKAPGAAPSKEATKTARAIYGKIMEKLGNKTVTKDIPLIGTITVHVADVFKSIFADENQMIELLPSLTISVKVKNTPAPGQSDCNPIIFWGFDINNSFDE